MDDKNIDGPCEKPDQLSHVEYQHRLEKKIDNILEISDLKDKHPYEDYENFETSTRRPGYFRNPVRFFNPLENIKLIFVLYAQYIFMRA